MNRGAVLRLLATGVLLFCAGCMSGANQYMVRDTPEFEQVTRRVAGQWTVTSYKVEAGARDLLPATFEKAEVGYDFDSGHAQYRFWVSPAKLGEKLADWQKQYPGIQIDEYQVVVTAPWSVAKDGKAIELGDKVYELVIKGSGENFDGFYDWERSKFEAAKSAGSVASETAGGLGGLMALAASKLADKATKSATGMSDLFVEVADINTFQLADDGNFLLCGKGAVYKADDVSSCNQATSMRRTQL